MMLIAPWLQNVIHNAVNSLLTTFCSNATGQLIGDPLEAQTAIARQCYRPGAVGVSGPAVRGGSASSESRCSYQGRKIV